MSTEGYDFFGGDALVKCIVDEESCAESKAQRELQQCLPQYSVPKLS